MITWVRNFAVFYCFFLSCILRFSFGFLFLCAALCHWCVVNENNLKGELGVCTQRQACATQISASLFQGLLLYQMKKTATFEMRPFYEYSLPVKTGDFKVTFSSGLVVEGEPAAKFH